MTEDIKKTINELHIYEKKLLKELKNNPNITPEQIANNTGMDIKSVMSAAGSLAAKEIITVEKQINQIISLTDNGKNYAEFNLPERRILNILATEKKIPLNELAVQSQIDKKDTGIAIGWLNRKQWATIDKGIVKITDKGLKSKEKLGSDELLLKHLLKFQSAIKNELSPELIDGFKLLNNRKNLINIKKDISHSFNILDKGSAILDEGFKIQKQATQLTHKQLSNGEWRNLQYRPYDINAESPKIFIGKEHPLRRIIEEIREIFLNMGFTESNRDILDSAFWNFDSLFQPQDHAAREMQDTFYVKNPLTCDLPDDEHLIELTREVHENGSDTGSSGWQYEWNEDIARQSVLRTHTTGVSTKYLYENEPPFKMFSVGRVFRRETITYKHLPEFHQVEGIIGAPEISYQNLLGVLKEFYKKLGFEVRFRPAYFPYTYLSTECEVYLEDKQSWIELGGSGMFRPEVLKPLNIDVPVLAFGLGIERLAMIRYDISDIRMLYKSDIGWLRNLPITQGIDL